MPRFGPNYQSLWLEKIVKALQMLGGEASLPDIYDQIQKNSQSPLPASWRSTVRQQLQYHDPDSRHYQRKQALFFHSARAKWGLRPKANM
jgi:hypothetical protein